jgi:hypothetical protein
LQNQLFSGIELKSNYFFMLSDNKIAFYFLLSDPGSYGIWADICGSTYLFGKELVYKKKYFLCLYINQFRSRGNKMWQNAVVSGCTLLRTGHSQNSSAWQISLEVTNKL